MNDFVKGVNATPSEQNKFLKEMEEITRTMKDIAYPMQIVNGSSVATLLPLEPIGDAKKYSFEKGDFSISYKLQKYKFFDPTDNKFKEIVLPDMGTAAISIKEVYELGYNVFKFTEALRQFINLSTCTLGPVVDAGYMPAGAVLADRISGLQGLSTPVENALKEVFDNGWRPVDNINSFNDFCSYHSGKKRITNMKDKFLSGCLTGLAEGCQSIAKMLANPNTISKDLGSTNTVPTVINDAVNTVEEISSLKAPKKVSKDLI